MPPAADARTPRITQVRAVPVAGRDSMLLNLSGAHGPYFTRNIVLIEDEAGHQGVGEVPGGEAIRSEIQRLGQSLIGQPIGRM
ncbi:MAG: glucarate dehydratase, partial [Castellaniella sp.]